jgi:hypothetical protein
LHEYDADAYWNSTLRTLIAHTTRIGAKLKVLSRSGAGTEVELRVPGDIAFESNSSSSGSKWFTRVSGRIAFESQTSGNVSK